MPLRKDRDEAVVRDRGELQVEPAIGRRTDADVGLAIVPRHLSTTDRRLEPQFQTLFARIWADLRDEVGTSLESKPGD